MKLLNEAAESFEIQESSGKEPKYYLEGIFLQANIRNRNGRIYPMDVMKPEVERYIREYVNEGRALGELCHPQSSSATPNINLERVSHKIEKIWQDGDYFKARALILDTPYGKIAKELIKSGCKLGVSSRALGSVTRRNGTDYVGKDFRLITAGDIVWEPSAQAAFPEGIMEDVDWVFDEATGEWTKSIPEELDLEKLAKMQKDEFNEFLETLKRKHK